MANRASAVRYSIESADDDIRPKRGTGGVSFQPKLSVFSITGTENEFEMSGRGIVCLTRLIKPSMYLLYCVTLTHCATS